MNADLTLRRKLEAPRDLVWRCWTEPELLKRWFCPCPHSVTEAIIDLRPGGRFFTRMLVEGKEHPNNGSFLEVIPCEKLAFTDLLLADWRPAAEPSLGFVAIVTLGDDGSGTVYEVLARHGAPQDAEKHEAMGFSEGWGVAAEQLDALALSLREGRP